LKSNINNFSKAIRKASLKTFQYLLVAKGAPENVAFFKEIYQLLAMNIMMALKKEDVKEIKLLFKELFHCMRVISQNEVAEHQKFFENVSAMEAFGKFMK